MSRWVCVAPTVLVLPLVAGCGGASVDAACDVDGVTHEIEHILSEAGATMGEFVSLTCADGWSSATVTVAAEASDAREESFLLRGTDMGWILTSPEEACSPGTPFAIPEALRASTCPQ